MNLSALLLSHPPAETPTARPWTRWGTLFLLPFLALSLTHCAGKRVDENDPASLMQEAEEEIESSHYLIAVDKLRVVKNKFPYSKFAPLAQLRIGDVYYLQESFQEAALSYETFRDLHPRHEKLPYAMFRIGKSHYEDSPTNVARDLNSAHRAMDAFKEFLVRFPQATEAAEAQELVNEIRKKLANKELYIANFYYRDDAFESAKARYQKIIDLFPETPAALEAKERMQKIPTTPAPPPKENT